MQLALVILFQDGKTMKAKIGIIKREQNVFKNFLAIRNAKKKNKLIQRISINNIARRGVGYRQQKP